eukprot:scaffold1782_cov414-Prasinococcus_capsulatus_cf.AAC.14
MYRNVGTRPGSAAGRPSWGGSSRPASTTEHLRPPLPLAPRGADPAAPSRPERRGARRAAPADLPRPPGPPCPPATGTAADGYDVLVWGWGVGLAPLAQAEAAPGGQHPTPQTRALPPSPAPAPPCMRACVRACGRGWLVGGPPVAVGGGGARVGRRTGGLVVAAGLPGLRCNAPRALSPPARPRGRGGEARRGEGRGRPYLRRAAAALLPCVSGATPCSRARPPSPAWERSFARLARHWSRVGRKRSVCGKPPRLAPRVLEGGGLSRPDLVLHVPRPRVHWRVGGPVSASERPTA